MGQARWADARPVVRCRDCRAWWPHGDGAAPRECPRCGWGSVEVALAQLEQRRLGDGRWRYTGRYRVLSRVQDGP